MGSPPFPVGDAPEFHLVCLPRAGCHPADRVRNAGGGHHRLRFPSADRGVPLFRYPQRAEQIPFLPVGGCNYRLFSSVLPWLGIVLCRHHRSVGDSSADRPTMLGIHPFRHRPQELAGRGISRRLHGVPLCVRGGEFYVNT